MNYNWLKPGYDPTPSPTTPTNAQLLQMWTDSRPADGVGMIIWAEDAPDAVNYPDVASALWGELDSGSQERTGNFFWYDGANWQPFTLGDGTLSGDAFANQTISIQKLVPGDALTILRTKSIPANGTEWVPASSVFSPNTMPIVTLANAADAGYVLFSTTGGTWTATLFDELWDDRFSVTNISYAQLVDVPGTGQALQIPYLPGPGSSFGLRFVDEVLRDGRITPRKLSYGNTQAAIATSTVTIDGNLTTAFELSLTSNVTSFAVVLADGQNVSVAIHQTGSFTITGWDASIKWAGGVVPVITASAGKTDVITFLRVGSNVYAAILQNYTT